MHANPMPLRETCRTVLMVSAKRAGHVLSVKGQFSSERHYEKIMAIYKNVGVE